MARHRHSDAIFSAFLSLSQVLQETVLDGFFGGCASNRRSPLSFQVYNLVDRFKNPLKVGKDETS